MMKSASVVRDKCSNLLSLLRERLDLLICGRRRGVSLFLGQGSISRCGFLRV
jgi:hypothetical protein